MMTTEQVIELLGDSDSCSDLEDVDDELEVLDDPHEPIMDGSDDEFSDLGEVEEDGDDIEDLTGTPFPMEVTNVHMTPMYM